MAIYKPRREASEETDPIDLKLPSLSVVHKLPCLWHFVLTAQMDLRHQANEFGLDSVVSVSN